MGTPVLTPTDRTPDGFGHALKHGYSTALQMAESTEPRPDGPALQNVRDKGINPLAGGAGFGERTAAAKEIKNTTYAVGTLGHITQNPMKYTFGDRMKAMEMAKAQPLDTQTDMTPGGNCCTNMCTIL